MRVRHFVSTSAVLGSLMVLFGAFPTQAEVPLSWNDALQDSSILEEMEPVDIVYTWVDGGDRSWKKERKHWLKKTHHVAKEAVKIRRFRSHNELKYSLRSINDFAPFVRHIYIVTSGQRPSWLADHPKISVVSHKEIFSHPEFLPTFNSIAIESNLHHIPGLANRYIYLNDDVFLGKPVTRKDFFSSPYKIKVFLSDKRICDKRNSYKSGLYERVSKNMATYLQKHLCGPGLEHSVNKNELRYHLHTPFPMIKWIAALTEKQFPRVFKRCSSHKFRSVKDLSITNGLIPQYALRLGVAEESKTSTVTFSFRGKENIDKAGLDALYQKKPTFFCIQDSAEKVDSAAEDCLNNFFETYYPNPAPWEK